ncbi:MAG: NAD(P)H-dependent oxidoreductase subunit E [Acidobacteriota bacterium]
MLSTKLQKAIEALAKRLPERQAAMLPALRLIQEEMGHVPLEERQWLAARLGVSAAAVEAVLSFYTLLKREPGGKHVIWVCSTLPCALRGCELVMDYLRKALGIREGETTADGRITLRRAECLGGCDQAPVVQVDEEYHDRVMSLDGGLENVSFERLDALLEKLT